MGTPIHHPADQIRCFLENEGVLEPFLTVIVILEYHCGYPGTSSSGSDTPFPGERGGVGTLLNCYCYSRVPLWVPRYIIQRIRYAVSWRTRGCGSPSLPSTSTMASHCSSLLSGEGVMHFIKNFAEMLTSFKKICLSPF